MTLFANYDYSEQILLSRQLSVPFSTSSYILFLPPSTMAKSPYDEFICSNSKDIGPAPWNQMPQPLPLHLLQLEEKNGRSYHEPHVHEEKLIKGEKVAEEPQPGANGEHYRQRAPKRLTVGVQGSSGPLGH
jgi:hypothetical protein